MTWLDAAIVVIFLYFIVTAFSAGFLRETIAMFSAIAGGILAGVFYDEVADTLLASIDNQTSASVAGFLIVFLGITLAGQALTMLMKPAVTVLQLGIADQLLGAAFGAIKAFVIVEVLLILFVTYPRYDIDQRIDDSQFAPRLLDAANPFLRILPSEFDARVSQFTQLD
jgi:membrane protein required for colicin V production